MRRRCDVVVGGHVCLDLIPRFDGELGLAPGELRDVGPLTIRPGGCVANTGLDLAALGVSVVLAAAIGRDRAGQLLLELLDRPGADISGVRVVDGHETSYSIVVEPPGGDRSFWHHVGANASFDGAELPLDGSRFLHIGYPPALPALHADGGAGLLGLLESSREAGTTTSIDLSTFGPASSAAAEDWPRLLDRVLPFTDVFAASVDDLRCAYGVEQVHRAADLATEFVERGAAVVLLKLGASGLHMATADRERFSRAGRGIAHLNASWADRTLHAPSIEVDVVSTTGAGDAAVAGLLYALCRSMDAEPALRAAAVAAAARISRHDGLPNWSTLSREWGSKDTVGVAE